MTTETQKRARSKLEELYRSGSSFRDILDYFDDLLREQEEEFYKKIYLLLEKIESLNLSYEANYVLKPLIRKTIHNTFGLSSQLNSEDKT